ncbi:M16 family metallopeptidase [Taibaiella soli]|uniref:Insulinase family protein n=1 Tax=Taibaiella soli TaxID=1649169 RepID=A0A2W2B2W0_9BACT|nr:pitrilysin family protein [Taibaiella soli]PZF74624.1 insulinase family protein [Taibaiella soli]
MKKITLSILTLALLSSVSRAQTLDRSIRPKAGPAPEVKLGKTETFTLSNGMKVFVVENHKLPTVEYSIQLDIKPELEGDMAGFRDMFSELMTSGTKTRSKDKLNEEIDFIGADVSATSEGLNGSSLKKHQDQLLTLMGDIAMNADFKQEELDKTKQRTLSGLEASKNEPDAMLKNVAAVLNYSTKHPYGEVSTETSVKKISLDRVKKYYSTYFRPNVAYMAVVGDITAAEVKPLLEKYFGKWAKATVPVATYAKPTAPATTGVEFVPRDGAVQSVINVTYPIDLKPGTPEVIKAKVAGTILGGGSQGRLFLNLREKHAWTYGSYSSITADELAGNFTAYAKCRNVVTDSSVGEILNEMNRLSVEKVDNESLQNTIAYMSGGFAMSLEDPARIAQFAINTERYHMPKDYYQNYLKNLAAVSSDDVMAISKKYITPANANIVVVGSKDESKKLAKYSKDGNIAYFDGYGRPLKETATAAAPAGVTADAVYNKYVAAIGGEKAINGLKDMKLVASGSIQGQTLTFTSIKKAPAQMSMVVAMGSMTLQKMVVNGDKGYKVERGQKVDLTADELKDLKQEADLQSDLHATQYGIKRTLKGMDKVNDKDVYVLDVVNAKGDKSTEYYDAATNFLVKKVEMSEQGAATTEFADYREVPGTNGYKVPYSVKIPAGPNMSIDSKVTTVEVNKGIADSEFQ